MQQNHSLHQGNLILQPKWLKPPGCPSQAGWSCREVGPFLPVGKSKGFPLPWERIRFPQTLVLKAHCPSLPLCSCSSTFFAFCLPPEMPPIIEGSSVALLLSVPAGTGLEETGLWGRGSLQSCSSGSPVHADQAALGTFDLQAGSFGATLSLTTSCVLALMG